MSDPDRVVVVVQGVVQGVGFRWFVQRAATDLGLSGWVRNRADGAVEVAAEGSREALEAFLASLADGPDGASVSEVSVRHEPATGALGGFTVRSGSHPGD